MTALVGQEEMPTVIGAPTSPICSIAARTATRTVSMGRALQAITATVSTIFEPREKPALFHSSGSPNGPRTKNSRNTTDHGR